MVRVVQDCSAGFCSLTSPNMFFGVCSLLHARSRSAATDPSSEDATGFRDYSAHHVNWMAAPRWTIRGSRSFSATVGSSCVAVAAPRARRRPAQQKTCGATGPRDLSGLGVLGSVKATDYVVMLCDALETVVAVAASTLHPGQKFQLFFSCNFRIFEATCINFYEK